MTAKLGRAGFFAAMLLLLGALGARNAPGGRAEGEPYRLDWWTIDGGGSTVNGGGYSLRSTSGQPDAGLAGGGTLREVGGFWAAAAPPPMAPSGLSCSAKEEIVGWVVTLRWQDAAPDASGFAVQRREAGGDWVALDPPAAAGATSYADVHVTAGTSYDYRVRAFRVKDRQHSEFSNTTTCRPGGRPVAPSELACNTEEDGGRWSIRLSWRDNSDESEFLVERRSDHDATWRELPAVPADVSETLDLGLDADTAFEYRVRAHRQADDNYSAYSDQTACSTYPRPAPPSLTCTADLQPPLPSSTWRQRLDWVNAAPDAGQIHLERRAAAAAWREFAAVDVTPPFLERRDMLPGESFSYRARVYRASPPQYSVYSGVADCTNLWPKLPVLFIPGIMGSNIQACDDFWYVAAPDDDLFWDCGAIFPWCGKYELPFPFHYSKGTNVWLDATSAEALIALDSRYLDVLRLKKDGFTPETDYMDDAPCLTVPEDNDGIFVEKPYGAGDIYLGLIKFLQGLGYSSARTPGRMQYFFPYDWRHPVEENDTRLDALIDQMRKTAGTAQVDILAHSMGGLVARHYILTHGASKIRQVITMGTPYLGAPKAAKVLEVGDNLVAPIKVDPFSWLSLNPSEIQQIAQNFAGLYDLLPGEGYFKTAESPENSYVTLSNGRALSYSQTKTFMADRHNAGLVDAADSLQASGVGNFAIGDHYHANVIVGYDQPTISRLRGVQLLGWELYAPVEERIGDGTVPLLSALASNLNANPSSQVYLFREPDRTGQAPDHGGLPLHKDVQELVGALLQGRGLTRSFAGSRSLAAAATGSRPFQRLADEPVDDRVTGLELIALGDAGLTLTDSQGRQAGPLPDPARGGLSAIPGVTYAQGFRTQTATITAAGRYTVTLRGRTPGSFAQLRITGLEKAQRARAVAYALLSVTSTTAATLTLTADGARLDAPPELRYRYGRGTPLTRVHNSGVLQGPAADDFLAPTTTLKVDDQGLVTLSAMDNPGGSGVARIEYSTDTATQTYRPYSAPFRPPSGTFVTARAVDRAENVEYPGVTTVRARLFLPRLLQAAGTRGGPVQRTPARWNDARPASGPPGRAGVAVRPVLL